MKSLIQDPKLMQEGYGKGVRREMKPPKQDSKQLAVEVNSLSLDELKVFCGCLDVLRKHSLFKMLTS